MTSTATPARSGCRRTARKVPATALACLVSASALPATAATGEVASSLHNLSVSGPGEVRALGETEICKFCHIPHNAVVPEPLWGHALSEVRHYETSRLRTGGGGFAPAPQPDGSSRLCLSCHDGTVALGEIAGEPRPLQMTGAQRLGRGRRGHLGTDLSGSHPISFVVPDGERGTFDTEVDIGLRSLGAIRADEAVRLDDQGKMQCTTCHDAHADRYYQPGRVPRFWVKPTVGEVCLTCHALR